MDIIWPRLSRERKNLFALGVAGPPATARPSIAPAGAARLGRSIARSVLGEIENVVGVGVDHRAGNSRRLDATATTCSRSPITAPAKPCRGMRMRGRLPSQVLVAGS